MQLNRRDFITALGVTAGGLAFGPPTIAFSQDRATVHVGNSSGIIDSQLVFMTAGQSPRLRYYERENVEMDIINMPGAGQTIQSTAAGTADVSAISPVGFLGAYAKNPSLDIVYPYCWLREAYWSIGVKPDSAVKELSELKGKKIGIRNQGDTGYFGARAMLSELGIDPDSDVDWIAVGEGGPAGDAVYKSLVDAMAFWDGGFARMEIAGYPLRQLPTTPGTNKLFGNCWGVRKSTLKEQRATLVRWLRASAKSTLFASTDLRKAVLLHWDIYPESKPRGISDEQAMNEALIVLNARAGKWLPKPGQKDQRFGAQSEEEWLAMVEFAGFKNDIKDVSGIFTNDLLDEVNDFDREEVIRDSKQLNI